VRWRLSVRDGGRAAIAGEFTPRRHQQITEAQPGRAKRVPPASRGDTESLQHNVRESPSQALRFSRERENRARRILFMAPGTLARANGLPFSTVSFGELRLAQCPRRCCAPPSNDRSRCTPNAHLERKISRFCYGLEEPVKLGGPWCSAPQSGSKLPPSRASATVDGHRQSGSLLPGDISAPMKRSPDA